MIKDYKLFLFEKENNSLNERRCYNVAMKFVIVIEVCENFNSSIFKLSYLCY